jgi:hypothetical protein
MFKNARKALSQQQIEDLGTRMEQAKAKQQKAVSGR